MKDVLKAVTLFIVASTFAIAGVSYKLYQISKDLEHVKERTHYER